jgi:putative SOS response-associated peptidase YedK
MCYSAKVWHDYRAFVRAFDAEISIREFFELMQRRVTEASIKLPKAMELAFALPQTDDEMAIKQLIDTYQAQQANALEQQLFKQKKRLADAERALQTKATKAATESKRIATDKIAWAMGKLSDLRRTQLHDRDARIYPGYYAPVMIQRNGRRVLVPMRYQCRPEGKPAFYDTKYPGCYNARRDNLEGFWRNQFGVTHGLIVVNAFYEHVRLSGPEGVEENSILEFRPQPTQDMLVACVWSHWQGAGAPDLLSFAAITDEPPPEIAAAGHDRCIIPIKPEHIDAWLEPDARDLKTSYAILDDRQRPYYAHRLAA